MTESPQAHAGIGLAATRILTPLITGHDSWKQTPCAYTVTRTAPTRATVILPSHPSTVRPRGASQLIVVMAFTVRARARGRAREARETRARCLVFFIIIIVVVKTRAREDDDAMRMRATDRSRGVHYSSVRTRARGKREGGRVGGCVRAERLTMGKMRRIFCFVVADERFRKGARARANDRYRARSGFPG